MIVSEAIKLIKERLNIADIVHRYVDLKQAGSRLVAPCPFHQETKPSFSVDPEKGFFHCFGCQASGDIFEFYSRINGLDFKESLAQLAEEAHIIIDNESDPAQIKKSREEQDVKRQMLRMHELAARHFQANLESADAKECREYIKKRGLSSEMIEAFGLGWASRDWHDLDLFLRAQGFKNSVAQECGLLGKSASGNLYDRFRGRLIFPIKNLSNQIIAFGGRVIDQVDEPKYINSQDTPIYKKKEHLYGLAQARRGISSKGFLILTEGYMDVLTLHQFGYDNSVGVLGTALTDGQIRRMGGFTSSFLLLFDGDRAGRKAALRSSEMILSRGLACNVALLPEGEDIDSMLRTRGKEAFEGIRKTAIPGLRFCVDVLNNLAPKEAVEWAKNFLSNIHMPELFGNFASQLAHHLGIDEKALRCESIADRKDSYGKPKGAPSHLQQMRNMRDTQIMIYAARYPERLGDLRNIGADLALSSARARELWDLLEQWGATEIVYHLDEEQKNFWNSQRMAPAPPMNDGDFELKCLEEEMKNYYTAAQQASLCAALAEKASSDSFEADLEYLRALQETLEKNDEQS